MVVMLERLMDSMKRKAVALGTAGMIFGSAFLADAASVTLKWDHNNPRPDGYVVLSKKSDNNWVPHNAGEENQITIDNLEEGFGYQFKVRAFKGTDVSGDSNIVFYAPMATSCNDFIEPIFSANVPEKTNRSSLRITGESSDNSGIVHTYVNNKLVKSGNGEWSFDVPMVANSENNVSIRVEDGCANVVSEDFSVLHSNIAPLIALSNSGLDFGVSSDGAVSVYHPGGHSSGDFSVPYRSISEGDNPIWISAADGFGNTSYLEKNLFARKGFVMLEDGEGGIRWSNASTVSIDDVVKREGNSALRFNVSGISPGQRRFWDLTLDSAYDMTKTIEQRASFFKDSSSNLEPYLYFSDGKGWHYYKFTPSDGWNDLVFSNDDGEFWSSIPDFKNIKTIRFAVYNRGNNTTNGSIVMDRLLGFKPIPIVNLDGNWIPSSESEHAVLENDEILFPADLTSGSYRRFWDLPIDAINLKDATSFRLLSRNLNSMENLHNQFYFRNTGNTWFKHDNYLQPGDNDFAMRKGSFIREGTVNDWSKINRVRYSTARHGSSPSFADVMVSTIGVNDDVFFELKDTFDYEPPVVTDFRFVKDDNGLLKIAMKYEDDHPVTAHFYDDWEYIGSASSSDGKIEMRVPMRVIDEGRNDISVMLEDSRWNYDEYQDSYNISDKRFRVLEDGEYNHESQIPWTNSQFISIERDNVVEGRSALKFDIGSINPGNRRLWDYKLNEIFDMDAKEAQRVSLYYDGNHAIEPMIYFSDGKGWHYHSINLNKGWNHIDLSKRSGEIWSSVPNYSNVNLIRFCVWNRGATQTGTSSYVIMDNLIANSLQKVIDIEDYSTDADVQSDWKKGIGAQDPTLVQSTNKQIYLPANLSNSSRGIWDYTFPIINYSNAENFRIELDSHNPNNTFTNQLYFKNSAGAWHYIFSDINHGSNIIRSPKDDFLLWGGSNPSWDINLIRVGTARNGSSPSGADVTLKGIWVDDLYKLD